MKIVFATNNEHKLSEIKNILGSCFEIVSLKDIGCNVDIPETAQTLEGNASIKSHFIYDNYHLNCFADDTGLEVDALNGEPGVHSARYDEHTDHDSEANMRKLLAKLGDNANRNAHFRTVISLIIDGEEHQFEAEWMEKSLRKSRERKVLATTLSLFQRAMTKVLLNLANKLRTKFRIEPVLFKSSQPI